MIMDRLDCQSDNSQMKETMYQTKSDKSFYSWRLAFKGGETGKCGKGKFRTIDTLPMQITISIA